MIIDRLIEAILEKGAPIVAGLDPRLEYVPEHIKSDVFEAYGKTLKGASEAFLRFNKAIIDAIYDIVPAVKLQMAMYEQYGESGIAAYIETVKHAKARGLIVIGDVKRSDIASSALAYSDGHIGRISVDGCTHEVYNTDFITINPYLGTDSVEPFLANCKEYDRGLFVLVKTSNPGGGELQDLITEGGEPLYIRVCELVAKWGASSIGANGYGAVGAVVGATHPGDARKLRERFPQVFFLVPGYGAQGGTAGDLSACFDSRGLGAVINNSRGIIAAYQRSGFAERFGPREFAAAARQAVLDMRDDLKRGGS